MTDRGEVALVLGVLELDLFLRQPVPIDRANQLLILFQQSLAEFLNFLFVHFCSSLSSKTLMVSQPGNGSICFTIAVSTGSLPCCNFSAEHPAASSEAPR